LLGLRPQQLQSEAVLRHLLNALLDLNGPDKVVELAILSPNPEKFYFDDKGPILDLRARDRKGGYYHVEVQLKGTDLDYTKRSLYYTTRLYSDQLKSGHDYHLLERSVSISLLDFLWVCQRSRFSRPPTFPSKSWLHWRKSRLVLQRRKLRPGSLVLPVGVAQQAERFPFDRVLQLQSMGPQSDGSHVATTASLRGVLLIPHDG